MIRLRPRANSTSSAMETVGLLSSSKGSSTPAGVGTSGVPRRRVNSNDFAVTVGSATTTTTTRTSNSSGITSTPTRPAFSSSTLINTCNCAHCSTNSNVITKSKFFTFSANSCKHNGGNNNNNNNGHHHAHIFNKRKWQNWSMKSSFLFVWTLLTIYVVLQIATYARIVLRGRPSWLYGQKTMKEMHVEDCLKNMYGIDPTHPPPTIASYNNNKVYWEWIRYSQETGVVPKGQTQEFKTYPRKSHRSSAAVAAKKRKQNHIDGISGDDSSSSSSSSIRSAKKKQPKEPKKVLIAQYSGFGSYAKLLDTVAPVNKAYAKYWGYDYVSLQGTSLLWHKLDTTDEDGTNSVCHFAPGPRATFDKVALLEAALQQNSTYDYMLLLDTDAMIVDFDVDVADLLPSDKALMAQRVWQWDVPYTWDINAGITLWNLHHPTTKTIFEQWKMQSSQQLTRVLVHNDDQYFLQSILLNLGEEERKSAVAASRREFYYYKATVVKHFKRESRSWTDTGLDERMERIVEAVAEICDLWPASCPKSKAAVMYSERTPL